MTYTSTKDLLTYFRQLMVGKHMQVKDVAINMNKTQGATSALLKQTNISLETLNELCQAIDCKLEVNIIPIEKDKE